MKTNELTAFRPNARITALGGATTPAAGAGRRIGLVLMARATVATGALMLAGCISVKAPDKPIVIELNINIKQEVVYKLDKGVQEMIDKNAEIF
ncbi:MAG: YnbE family lipoprotein [Novosphingobium sp.]